MNALTQAIFNKLSGDGALTAMLAVYPPASGTPAIFSAEPVPLDASLPYVCWNGPLHDAAWGGKTDRKTFREVTLDIRIYAAGVLEADGSSSSAKAIDNIAERVRTLLNEVTLTVSGYTNIIAQCMAGPIQIPTDPRFQGRAITFQYVLN